MKKVPITNYIQTVYPIIEHILYNIAVYRTIISRIKSADDGLIENPEQRDFWVNISNNAIQMAITDWCKVFGSERDNPFHCRKHLDFIVDEQIGEPMIRFRNKFIAHKTNVAVPVPMLDGALDEVYCFDQKIREQYDLDGYQELKGRYETYKIRIEDLMDQYEITKI